MADLAQLVSRLEAVVSRLEKVGGGDASAAAAPTEGKMFTIIMQNQYDNNNTKLLYNAQQLQKCHGCYTDMTIQVRNII